MAHRTIIDQKTFTELKTLMGADFMPELIETYIQETEELIDQLQLTLGTKDDVTFSRCAHSIKSSSASLGALAFSQKAQQLEIMGKNHDLATAGPLLAQLSLDFLEVKNSLEDLKHES